MRNSFGLFPQIHLDLLLYYYAFICKVLRQTAFFTSPPTPSFPPFPWDVAKKFQSAKAWWLCSWNNKVVKLNWFLNWLDGPSDHILWVAGKEGVTFFRAGCNFYIQNKIWKKKFINKTFFSVITKNSNWEFLTKNLVTFKR